ncbi:hypothetical protein GCM10010207_66240 [Streptomyces atratus]|uniref:transposase n=1 Tax=Streptomyces atratus TaxID=1893 RepID=UPI00167097BE|nr:transposase [Streptomyces atratus]GGT57170.1 hypothetical protein GCM10010207_66240 [Streptomyces atratus]
MDAPETLCRPGRCHVRVVRAARRPGQDLRRIGDQTARCDLRPIRSFVGFLRQDIDAVTAGLTLPYSCGVVAGHVCGIKLLKRRMRGRASSVLLRARILAPP